MTLRLRFFYRWRGRRAYLRELLALLRTPPIDVISPDDERRKLDAIVRIK